MSQKTCAECDAAIDRSTKVCPECGHAPRKAFALLGIGVIMAGSILVWMGILLFFPLLFVGILVGIVGVGILLIAPFVKATTGGSEVPVPEA